MNSPNVKESKWLQETRLITETEDICFLFLSWTPKGTWRRCIPVTWNHVYKSKHVKKEQKEKKKCLPWFESWESFYLLFIFISPFICHCHMSMWCWLTDLLDTCIREVYSSERLLLELDSHACILQTSGETAVCWQFQLFPADEVEPVPTYKPCKPAVCPVGSLKHFILVCVQRRTVSVKKVAVTQTLNKRSSSGQMQNQGVFFRSAFQNTSPPSSQKETSANSLRNVINVLRSEEMLLPLLLVITDRQRGRAWGRQRELSWLKSITVFKMMLQTGVRHVTSQQWRPLGHQNQLRLYLQTESMSLCWRWWQRRWFGWSHGSLIDWTMIENSR